MHNPTRERKNKLFKIKGISKQVKLNVSHGHMIDTPVTDPQKTPDCLHPLDHMFPVPMSAPVYVPTIFSSFLSCCQIARL